LREVVSWTENFYGIKNAWDDGGGLGAADRL
jgi:hypothetical protein